MLAERAFFFTSSMRSLSNPVVTCTSKSHVEPVCASTALIESRPSSQSEGHLYRIAFRLGSAKIERLSLDRLSFRLIDIFGRIAFVDLELNIGLTFETSNKGVLSCEHMGIGWDGLILFDQIRDALHGLQTIAFRSSVSDRVL